MIARAIAIALVSCALMGTSASAELHARGQLLAIDTSYLIFSTGDAIRLRAGTTVPKRATLGSVVLVTIDESHRDIDAVALDAPHASDEIAIADVPREYVIATRSSTRVVAARPSSQTPVLVSAGAPGGPGAASDGAIKNVTLEVTVPTNTPPRDDVFIATDRSNYSPAEIRMQRVDSRRFTATIALDSIGKLKYQYTRGSYATVERDRAGGIVEPHTVDRPQAKIDDTVTRWADLN